MGSKYAKNKIIGVILINLMQLISKLNGKVFRFLILWTKNGKIPGNSQQITHGAFFVYGSLIFTSSWSPLQRSQVNSLEGPYSKKGVWNAFSQRKGDYRLVIRFFQPTQFIFQLHSRKNFSEHLITT